MTLVYGLSLYDETTGRDIIIDRQYMKFNNKTTEDHINEFIDLPEFNPELMREVAIEYLKYGIDSAKKVANDMFNDTHDDFIITEKRVKD